MGRPHKCPYCGATETVSKGVRKTKTMGDRRIRLCRACKRKFTPKNQKQELVSQDEAASEKPEEQDVHERAEQPEELCTEGQQSPASEERKQMLPPPDSG